LRSLQRVPALRINISDLDIETVLWGLSKPFAMCQNSEDLSPFAFTAKGNICSRLRFPIAPCFSSLVQSSRAVVGLLPTYPEKRFRVRPAGVVSKFIGLLKIANAILSCNFRDAWWVEPSSCIKCCTARCRRAGWVGKGPGSGEIDGPEINTIVSRTR
jgi:hypothetical protein